MPTLTQWEVGITVDQRPEFTIARWDHEADTDGDDGLRKNQCWPSKNARDDPGFTLLNFGQYYNINPAPYDHLISWVEGSNGS